ncbi:hypothetical protein EUGRSUZ_G00502 [Eucalyptus grandis]|uniref:Uncharacterized protein n=2 Tax=Eucalyptus grandis TaxID=71139 RepID=A0A059BB72_EUCGR|nr:hypothetical protein EUGRSUZ_G00502 [Eucalyptus grandis]
MLFFFFCIRLLRVAMMKHLTIYQPLNCPLLDARKIIIIIMSIAKALCRNFQISFLFQFGPLKSKAAVIEKQTSVYLRSGIRHYPILTLSIFALLSICDRVLDIILFLIFLFLYLYAVNSRRAN